MSKKNRAGIFNSGVTARLHALCLFLPFQTLTDILLDAEVKLGEMLERIKPKYDLGSKGRTKTLPSGINKKQSHYAQQLSRNPDIVEEVKQKAREKGEGLPIGVSEKIEF